MPRKLLRPLKTSSAHQGSSSHRSAWSRAAPGAREAAADRPAPRLGLAPTLSTVVIAARYHARMNRVQTPVAERGRAG